MAAPSGIVWGGIVADYMRIGIYTSVSSNNTQSTVNVQVWAWTKYSIDDTSNKYYYDNNATSATTSQGSVTVKTTSNSGGWAEVNQVKIAETNYTYDRGTSAVTRNCAAKLSGIDYIGASHVMTCTTSYTIPALQSYTVSYNANGGSGAPSAQTKYYGKTLTLSSTKPTRSGYTFMGWSTANDTSVEYASGSNYTGNSALTLYAVWRKTITLTYNANGGSGAPSAQSANVYNATTSYKFTLSSTKPTRTGYTFLGWNTSSTATSASYSAGGNITLSSSDTLYAIWKLITYSVTYNANGGTGAPDSQTKTYGVNLTLSSTKPTRSGYKFLGWSTFSTATEPTYNPGATYTQNANLTLYAVWERLGIAHININGTWQRGRIWVNVDGAWKTGLVWINVDGVWKQGGA